MDLSLEGKNALVCGSSKGIGRAAAIELAALGANVTLAARDAVKLAAVKNELDKSKGQRHRFMSVDFSKSDELNSKVKTLVVNEPIQILVNNTGGPASGFIMDAMEKDFTQAFHNHLICSHLLVKILRKGMIKSGYGRIINIISTSVKQPLDNLGVSNTIRGAMASWAKTLSNELAVDGITVNNVLPGSTMTDRLKEIIQVRADRAEVSFDEMQAKMMDQIPMRRFGEAKEIAAAIGFLASPAAAYINGINLPVDGGRTKSL